MFDLKPKIRVMDNEQINKVHHDALLILEETGIMVDDQEARDLFQKAIGTSRDDNRIKIPKDLVQWAIAAAPSDIQIYDRLNNPCFK